jgi:hypothetical protein
MISSIKYAMQQRADKKNAYLLAVNDVEAKKSAHSKIAGIPGKFFCLLLI